MHHITSLPRSSVIGPGTPPWRRAVRLVRPARPAGSALRAVFRSSLRTKDFSDVLRLALLPTFVGYQRPV